MQICTLVQPERRELSDLPLLEPCLRDLEQSHLKRASDARMYAVLGLALFERPKRRLSGPPAATDEFGALRRSKALAIQLIEERRTSMAYDPLLISLPVADRIRAHDFYRDGLGLDAIGELADDGVPEPLMFVLNSMSRLMLVPTGGFGWVIGDHQVAPGGTSECVLGIGAATDDGVNEIVERARRAGATVATEPAPQPWGYAAAFADPDGHIWTVTSAKLPD